MRAHIIVLSLSLGSPFLATAASATEPVLEIAPAERAKMNVCTDGKSHYLVVAPHESRIHQLYYGDAKNMSIVPIDPSGMLSGHDFLDPRFPNPTANENFRGIDFRIYSSVEFDAKANKCVLRCGDRNQALTVLPAADARKIASDATFHTSPRTREPYKLARDDHGVYYYVDRGNTRETQNSFRVYVGKKGELKLQKMKDVAVDSEGEVFSTVTGDLRFITSHDNGQYTWLRAGKEVKLVPLPVRDNMTLIYTTLGVYTGQRFGTPCDDM